MNEINYRSRPGALPRKAIPWRKGKNVEKIGLKPNLGGWLFARQNRSHQRLQRPRACSSSWAQQKINIISAYTHCTSHRTNAWFVITSVSYFIPKAHNSSFIKHHIRESEWSGDEKGWKGREVKAIWQYLLHSRAFRKQQKKLDEESFARLFIIHRSFERKDGILLAWILVAVYTQKIQRCTKECGRKLKFKSWWFLLLLWKKCLSRCT